MRYQLPLEATLLCINKDKRFVQLWQLLLVENCFELGQICSGICVLLSRPRWVSMCLEEGEDMSDLVGQSTRLGVGILEEDLFVRDPHTRYTPK